MLFYYIRHADPIYSPDSLTDLGRMQADALKSRFAAHGLDKIYASSSIRAQLTAEPTAKMLKKDVEILDWAHETKAWNQLSLVKEDGNRTWHFCYPKSIEVMASAEMYAFGERWYEHPYFAGSLCGEGIERIKREADALFLSLGYRHDRERRVYIPEKPNEERVALFAHEGFGLAFLSAVLDIPYPSFCTHFGIGHSMVTIIDFRVCGEIGCVIPKVISHSNDSHIFAGRLPTKYNNGIYI